MNNSGVQCNLRYYKNYFIFLFNETNLELVFFIIWRVVVILPFFVILNVIFFICICIHMYTVIFYAISVDSLWTYALLTKSKWMLWLFGDIILHYFIQNFIFENFHIPYEYIAVVFDDVAFIFYDCYFLLTDIMFM